MVRLIYCSSKKIRKTQNEHLNIICQNLIGQRVQKDAEQNFDKYEYPMWDINYNLRTFLKSSKPLMADG